MTTIKRLPPYWVNLILGGFLLFQGTLGPRGYVGKEHDDALYFLAAQSLKEGDYHQWYEPGNPRITTLTPGLPALLTPGTLLWPENTGVAQWTMVGLLMAATMALWFFFRLVLSPSLALLLTGLFALNPLVLTRAGVLMPEVPYLGGLLLFLIFIEKKKVLENPSTPWPSSLLTGAALAGLYLIRPAAVTLWAAVALAFLGRRNFRGLFKTFLIPLVTYGAWALWSQTAGGVQEHRELGHQLGTAGVSGLFSIVGNNIRFLATTWGDTLLPLSWTQGLAPTVLGLGLLLTCLTGLTRALRTDRPLWALTLIVSLGMHAVWPWWYDRYLLPLLPLLWWGVLWALPTSWRESTKFRALLGIFLSISFWSQSWPLYRLPNPTAPQPEAALRWIQDNTAPTDLLASLFYGKDILHAQRIFVPVPLSHSAQELAERLDKRRVRYVLWEFNRDFGFSKNNATTRTIEETSRFFQDPTRFRQVFKDPEGKAAIYTRVD